MFRRGTPVSLREEALEYHAKGRPGKIEVTLTKPCATQRDLSLAYTPGVAEPVREIYKDPLEAFKYTARGELFIKLGVNRANVILVDTKGVVYKGRTEGMNPYKARFAVDTDRRTLADAMRGADVFVGLSAANTVTREMVKSMAEEPFICAMANPDPEIPYDEAKSARPDAIVATGRSDFPNQVNNVLGFPFIFRGALDVR